MPQGIADFVDSLHTDTVKPVCNDHFYINLSPVIDLVKCFNGDWRYQFTLDELKKAEKYPIRWSL